MHLRHGGLRCGTSNHVDVEGLQTYGLAFLSRGVLGFSNIVGNFGVVLMIGGNISSRTRVVSTVIFDYVETMQWREANILAGGMVVFAFVVILSMILIQKRYATAGA